MFEDFKNPPRERLYESIMNACQRKNIMGQNITVRGIREEIGIGSHTTILKYIKLWRSMRLKSHEIPKFNKRSKEIKSFDIEKFTDQEREDFLNDEADSF